MDLSDDLLALDSLRALSDAYLAIARGETLEERVGEVCAQTKRFFAAADVSLVFGREAEGATTLAGDRISALLLGGAAVLTVTAAVERRWTTAERAALEQLAALISAPVNDARRLESAERVARLGALLGGVAQPEDVLSRFCDVGVNQIGAAWSVVRLVDGAGVEVGDASGAADLLDAVLRDGMAVFESQRGDDGEQSWAALPLGGVDTRFGVLAIGFADPQPFDEVQRAFLADVASRLTAALERSQAYAGERRARQEAELASGRLRDLQSLATDLALAATRRRVAQVLLRRATTSTSAAGGAVVTFGNRQRIEVLASNGALRSLPDLPTFLAMSIDDSRTRDIGSLVPLEPGQMPAEIRARLTADGIRTLAQQPISTGGRTIGVLVLGWNDEAGLYAVDQASLQAQATMAAQTLQRAARYDVEHSIADTLQRSLLALPPITVQGLRWSVLYRAGSPGLAGGDWYDLVEINDHRVAIAVGDIVGRGVEAAASMGQLRSATRALAARTDTPAELVRALDDFTVSTGQGRHSSLAYVILDTSSGELAHVVAGHPPPVLRAPDGSTTVLETGRGPLLGVQCERRGAVRRIEPGTQLVMYTDGLFERRNEGIDVGLARLVAAVGEPANLDPDGRCQDLVDRLLGSDPGRGDEHDDVAIVVVELASD